MTSGYFPKQLRSRRPGRAISTAVLAISSLMTAACASLVQTPQQPSVTSRNIDSHVSEELRASIKTVAVRPNGRRPTLYVEGDYEKTVLTPGDGAKVGAGAGLKFTGEMLSEDARSIILVPIILPVAMIVGSIGGAAAAKIQQEIQEFRDELTAELTDESNPPLGGDILAEALRSRLENSHDIETILIAAGTPAPTGIDAIVDIRVIDLTITVEDSDAIMTTTAVAELRLAASNRVVYHRSFDFSDKNSLSKWVKDENALWSDYIDRARHHFTRSISDDFFEEILLRHVLRPTRSDDSRPISGKKLWSNTVKTPTPTFTWELILLGDDAYGEWADDIDADSATYELEVYRDGSLVYAADNISTTHHEAQRELEGCRTYSWSVRPRYQIDGKTRTGEWMRYTTHPGAFSRSKQAETPEFWSGFPTLKIRC